jgi:hypothetical protein
MIMTIQAAVIWIIGGGLVESIVNTMINFILSITPPHVVPRITSNASEDITELPTVTIGHIPVEDAPPPIVTSAPTPTPTQVVEYRLYSLLRATVQKIVMWVGRVLRFR